MSYEVRGRVEQDVRVVAQALALAFRGQRILGRRVQNDGPEHRGHDSSQGVMGDTPDSAQGILGQYI